MRGLLITRIVLLAIIIIILTGILVATITHGGINMNWESFVLIPEDSIIVFEETINSEEIENIRIDWTSGIVEVKPTSSDEIRIIQRSKYELSQSQVLQLKHTGGDVEIKEGRRRTGWLIFGFGTGSTSLEVYLPNKEYNELYFKNSSGRVDVENIAAKTVILGSTSGIIDLNDINADKFDINITSGKITCQNVQANILNTKTTSGLIDIDGEIEEITAYLTSGTISIADNIMPQKLNMEVTSGRLNIEIPENEGFTVKSRVTSGRFTSDFNLVSQQDGNGYSSIDNRIRNAGTLRYKDGGNEFNVRVTSGTIALNRL